VLFAVQVDFGIWNDLGGVQEKKPARQDFISAMIEAMPQRFVVVDIV